MIIKAVILMLIMRATRRNKKMIVSIYNYWRFRNRRKSILDRFKEIFSHAYRWDEQDIIFYEALVENLDKR